MPVRILLAEDERDLNRIVAARLAREGWAVDAFLDGAAALDAAAATEYDAAVLDVMMPGADGYAVLEALRSADPSVPVLFLTARDSVDDRVRGLDAGANDYLVKPFALRELLARVRAMVRAGAASSGTGRLVVGDLELDPAARCAFRAGEEVALSATEFSLLEYLVRNAGTVLSRDRIEAHVWGNDWGSATNVVDVYVGYLRRKLGDDPSRRLIHTVRGVGYVLREASS